MGRWSRTITALLVMPASASAQGLSPSSPVGLHRVIIPPAATQGPAAEGLMRIPPAPQPGARVGAPAVARAGSPTGERKATLPPPPPKEELAFAPAAIAAGTAASGLATGGLAFPPLLGLVGIAGVGAAAAVAGGGGGSGPVATVSTR